MGTASASPLHSRSPSPNLQRRTPTAAVAGSAGTGTQGLGGLPGNSHSNQNRSGSHHLQYGRDYPQPQYHHHGQHGQHGQHINSPQVSLAQTPPSHYPQHPYGAGHHSTHSNNMASSHLATGSSMPSKRDKRRNLLSDRLTELSASFDRNRDLHYRDRLAALQQELNAIARADTSGRDLRLLDDGADGIDNAVTVGVQSGDGVPVSNIRGSGGPSGALGGVQPGSFYAGFVAEVNEKMEERDVALALLHKQYHAKVAAINTQHERNIHHAREEQINLAVTMKQRLINRLYNAKKKLSTDKEHLDITDTNALLLHPNQFSLGSAAAGVLGSPSRNDLDRGSDIFGSGAINGGNGISSGGRRKLRQRRNELDDLQMMGPGGIFDNFGSKNAENGDTRSAAAQRRKARAARRRINGVAEDEENTMEDIYGNVHFNGGLDGDGNNSGNNSAVGAAVQKQKQVQSVGNGHAAMALQQFQAQEMLHKQVYSIEKLFTEKELQMAGNLAALATVKYFSRPKERSRKSKKGGKGDPNGGEEDNGDSDPETRTPGEEAEARSDAAAGVTTGTAGPASTTASDEQPKSEEQNAASTSSPTQPHDLSSLPPSALFLSAIASSANHTRSMNPPIPITHATPLATNPSALASHPPPSVSALNFMTPTASGYGAPVWQSLGVPAAYFTAGTGSLMNAITTSKIMTLSAPCPPAAKGEEVQQDLEMIRSGRGLEEVVDEDEEGDEGDDEDESEGADSKEGKPRTRGEGKEQRKENDKDMEKEGGGSPSPSLRSQKSATLGLALGLGVGLDELEAAERGGTEELDIREKSTSAPPPLPLPPAAAPTAVTELAHGLKRRASSGAAGGGAEKRVRKDKERERERGRERQKEKESEQEKEKRASGGGMVDGADDDDADADADAETDLAGAELEGDAEDDVDG